MQDPDQLPYHYTGQKRLFLILAAFWVTVGLSLLSFAAYTYTKGDSTAAGDQLAYLRPIVATPTPVVGGVATGPVSPLTGQNMHLVIDKLGVNAPVAAFGLDANAVPQVPYEANLVAWYNFSAVPGSGSNAVFAGHVTWFGDAVFHDLGELGAGDSVIVQGDNGDQLLYKVTSNELVTPTLEAVRKWMDGTDQDVITLITCGGTFTWTNDAIYGGEYSERQVVRAELVGRVLPGQSATGG